MQGSGAFTQSIAQTHLVLEGSVDLDEDVVDRTLPLV
jgi:hypothetical protein